MSDNNKNNVYSTQNVSTEYDIYITGSIGDPKDYLNEFSILRTATSSDRVNLRINSSGGQIRTTLQFIAAMADCEAEIVAHIEGECHSAATYLFLMADTWVVSPYSIMLVHNYSAGDFGKGGELDKSYEARRKWITGICKTIYKDFLTHRELKNLHKDQDLWLHSEEIIKRIQRVISAREAMEKENEKELREKVLQQVKEITNDSSGDSTSI